MDDLHPEIQTLRGQVDTIDEELLRLLAKRMEVVRQIGDYKEANKLSALDTERWNTLLAGRLATAGSLHLSLDFATKFFELIHAYALEIQQQNS